MPPLLPGFPPDLELLPLVPELLVLLLFALLLVPVVVLPLAPVFLALLLFALLPLAPVFEALLLFVLPPLAPVFLVLPPLAPELFAPLLFDEVAVLFF